MVWRILLSCFISFILGFGICSILTVGKRGDYSSSSELMLIVIAEQGIIIVARGEEQVNSLFPSWQAMLKADADASYKGKVLAVMVVRVLREDKGLLSCS